MNGGERKLTRRELLQLACVGASQLIPVATTVSQDSKKEAELGSFVKILDPKYKYEVLTTGHDLGQIVVNPSNDYYYFVSTRLGSAHAIYTNRGVDGLLRGHRKVFDGAGDPWGSGTHETQIAINYENEMCIYARSPVEEKLRIYNLLTEKRILEIDRPLSPFYNGGDRYEFLRFIDNGGPKNLWSHTWYLILDPEKVHDNCYNFDPAFYKKERGLSRHRVGYRWSNPRCYDFEENEYDIGMRFRENGNDLVLVFDHRSTFKPPVSSKVKYSLGNNRCQRQVVKYSKDENSLIFLALLYADSDDLEDINKGRKQGDFRVIRVGLQEPYEARDIARLSYKPVGFDVDTGGNIYMTVLCNEPWVGGLQVKQKDLKLVRISKTKPK